MSLISSNNYVNLKRSFIIILLSAFGAGCVKGPPPKNLPKESRGPQSVPKDTIIVEKTLKIATPPFKEMLANHKGQVRKYSLRQIYSRGNSPKDVEVWFDLNEFEKPVCLIMEGQSDCSTKIPKEYDGLTLVNGIPTEDGYFLIYGKDTNSGHLVLLTDPEMKKAQYALDFSNFLASSNVLPPKDQNIAMGINYVKVENGTLYVTYGHKNASKLSQGLNAFMAAIRLSDGKILWHSESLASNANNFIILKDYIVTGYGFTSEPDYLHLINKFTGQIVERLPLKTGPEFIVHRGNEVYVRTYNTNYIFEIDHQE